MIQKLSLACLFLFLLPSCFLFKSQKYDKDVLFIGDQNLVPCAPKNRSKQCWKSFGYKYENGDLVKIEVQILDFSSGGSSIQGQYAHVSIKELDRIQDEQPSYDQLCQFYEGQLMDEKCHLRKKSPFQDYCQTAGDSSLKTKLCSRFQNPLENKDG